MNMQTIFPKKLKPGDTIRIIAPSQSMAIISQQTQKFANRILKNFGFKVTFGKHVNETDKMQSSSVKSRLDDLHEAFADPTVKGIFTAIGGYNCNQLLDYINWDIINKNPKIFCGYSDITALNNAIFTKTGLTTYSGPHYSTFGRKHDNKYTEEYFRNCLMTDSPYEIKASKRWDDRKWYIDQEDRTSYTNKGPVVINKGQAEGTIIGDNLGTLGLLKGTEYFPDLTHSILFLEDCDSSAHPVEFDRNLQALIQQPNFDKVRCIVIGRFEKAAKMSKEMLTYIIKTKKELTKIPVIANVDFGHTDPKITFPIGGAVSIVAEDNNTRITITKH